MKPLILLLFGLSLILFSMFAWGSETSETFVLPSGDACTTIRLADLSSNALVDDVTAIGAGQNAVIVGSRVVAGQNTLTLQRFGIMGGSAGETLYVNNVSGEVTDVVGHPVYTYFILNLKSGSSEKILLSTNNGSTFTVDNTEDYAGGPLREWAFLYGSASSGLFVTWRENSNVLRAYETQAHQFITLATIAGLSSIEKVVGFSDGTSFIIGKDTQGNASVYRGTGYTSSTWNNVATLDSGEAQDIIKTPNGKYMLVVKPSSGIIKIYRSTNGITFSQQYTFSDNTDVRASATTPRGSYITFVSGRTLWFKDDGVMQEVDGFYYLTMIDAASAPSNSTGVLYPSSTPAKSVKKLDCNVKPTLFAGADQTLHSGNQATLAATVSDEDGGTVSTTWTQISGPSVTIVSPQAEQLTPTLTLNGDGTYVFEISAVDNGSPIAMATDQVSIILNSNQAPVLNLSNKTCVKDAACVLKAAATDPDDTSLSFTMSAAYGNVNYSETTTTGSVQDIITATNTASGELVFVGVDDQHGNHVAGMFTLNVVTRAQFDPDNAPPSVSSAVHECLINQPCNIPADATDPDGDELLYFWEASDASFLNWQNRHSETTIATPTHLGSYIFPIEIDDQVNPTVLANVHVNVVNTLSSNTPDANAPDANAPTNQPPLVTLSPTFTFSSKGQSSQFVPATASDPEGGLLTYAWETISGDGDDGLFWQVANQATGTIQLRHAGEYTIRLTVTDAAGMSASAESRVTFTNTNHAPTAHVPSVNCVVNETCTLNIEASDEDNDALFYFWNIGGQANLFSIHSVVIVFQGLWYNNLQGQSTQAISLTPLEAGDYVVTGVAIDGVLEFGWDDALVHVFATQEEIPNGDAIEPDDPRAGDPVPSFVEAAINEIPLAGPGLPFVNPSSENGSGNNTGTNGNSGTAGNDTTQLPLVNNPLIPSGRGNDNGGIPIEILVGGILLAGIGVVVYALFRPPARKK